jgi:hypothetical protein
MTPHDDNRLSDLYRAGAREEPSARLDARIREAGRREQPRRRHRWVPALATAAVLVLAVAVLIRVPEQAVETERAPTEARQQAAEPAPPAVSGAARKSAPARVLEEAPRFDTYAVPPGDELPAAPLERERAIVADEADIPIEAVAEGLDCAAPAPELARDPAALRARIEALEADGQEEAAACLRRWLESAESR